MYILCDLDGTLIDTDKANYLAYKEAVSKIKKIDLVYNYNKRFTRDTLKLVLPNLSVKEFDEIIKIKTDIFQNYLEYTKLNIKFINYIKQISKNNNIILATNSHRKKADLLLKHYNIFNLFDMRYYKESYIYHENNKYAYIFNDIKVDVNKILIFEDNINEIEKAIKLHVSPNHIINIRNRDSLYE